MKLARKPIDKKLGRGTSLAESREAMHARAGTTLRIVRANKDRARDSLRIKLVE